MKKLFTLLGLVLLVPSLLFAGENSHRAAAEELLAVSKADKMLEPVYKQLDNMLEQQFHQIAASDEDRAILSKYSKKMGNMLRKQLDWEKMKEDIIEIYMKVYSEKELREISKFYRSATGQKLLEKMPQVVEQTMIVSQRNMEQLIPELQKLSEEMAKELQQRHQQAE